MIQKIKDGIKLLQDNQPKGNYHLAFSGGKDSIVILHLAKMAGIRYRAHYQQSMEPPDVVQFIIKEYPEVERHPPEKTMYQLIVENGIPPMRNRRYCCRYMKERGGRGEVCITGVRWCESRNRKDYEPVSYCDTQDKTFVCPILSWSDKEVWGFIDAYHLKYPEIYKKGFSRVGCILCPNNRVSEKRLYIQLYPRVVKAYIHALDKMIKTWGERGCPRSWKTGQECFDWWINI